MRAQARASSATLRAARRVGRGRHVIQINRRPPCREHALFNGFQVELQGLRLRPHREGKRRVPPRRRHLMAALAMASLMVDPTPPRIRASMARLIALRNLYLVPAAAEDRAALAVIGQVDSVVANVTDLFRRLSVKAY